MTIWDTGLLRRGEVVRRRGQVRAPRREGVTASFVLFQTKDRNWMIHRHGPSTRSDPLPTSIKPMLAVRRSAAAGRRELGLRDQVGRHPGDPLRRRRQGPRAEPERPRRQLVVPRVGGHRRVPRHDHLRARRRDRRARRGRPAELLQAATPHARGEPAGGAAAGHDRTPSASWRSTCCTSTGTRCWPCPMTSAGARLESLHLSGATFTTTESFRDVSGQDILAATVQNGLEGVVAKRRDSPYRPGRRHPDWIKVKSFRTQEVVIGGWTEGRGEREGSLGALLLGIPDGDGLRYVGKVGTGFSDIARRDAPRGPAAAGDAEAAPSRRPCRRVRRPRRTSSGPRWSGRSSSASGRPQAGSDIRPGGACVPDKAPSDVVVE